MSSGSAVRKILIAFLWIVVGFVLGVHVAFYMLLYSNKLSTNIDHLRAIDESLPFIPNVEPTVEIPINEIRLLCWIMNKPNETDRRAAILETWGKRCNLVIFVIGDAKLQHESAKAESLGDNALLVSLKMTDSYLSLWQKTKLAFQYIERVHKDNFDWVLKVDDDSYVIVDNLRTFLKEKQVEDKFYYGFHFKTRFPAGYNSGGPGYVMSMRNVQRLTEAFNISKCHQGNDGPEDVNIGGCLALMGIVPGNSTDTDGRLRFVPTNMINMLDPKQANGRIVWFINNTKIALRNGIDCCSDSAISFHYSSSLDLRMLEYYIYHLRPSRG